MPPETHDSAKPAGPPALAAVEVPEFFCDEDGQLWYALGVVPETDARLALAVHYLKCEHYGPIEDGYREAFDLGRTATYAVEWWKDPGGDVERMVRCKPNDPTGAQFTIMRER